MFFIKKITLSQKTKKEIKRYLISFFFAWLVSALISDFPYPKYLLIQSIGLDDFLLKITVSGTKSVLAFLGYDVYSNYNHLYISGTRGIRYLYGCLGFRHIAFFVVFIILQTGKIKNKIWYIPTGVTLLVILNILRTAIIAVSQLYSPENTRLIHDIVSPVFMYPTILFLWLYWLHKYS